MDDAHLLMSDYNINVSGCIDLRYLAQECYVEERSLAALAYKLLGCKLDKDWQVRASDWETEELNDRQTEYAALDAYVAVKIFEQLRNKKVIFSEQYFESMYVYSFLIDIMVELVIFIRQTKMGYGY